MTYMRIVLFGAAGNMGRRIAREALGRGHQITAVVRDPKSFQPYDDRLTVVKGDATDAESVAAVSAGAGAVVDALSSRPRGNKPPAAPRRQQPARLVAHRGGPRPHRRRQAGRRPTPGDRRRGGQPRSPAGTPTPRLTRFSVRVQSRSGRPAGR